MVGQVRDYAEVLRVNDARTYATYESDYYAGMPAVTVKDTGKGSAYYVAARLDNESMQNLFGRILKRAGVSIKKECRLVWNAIHVKQMEKFIHSISTAVSRSRAFPMYMDTT